MSSAIVKCVPYGAAQNYLADKFNIPPKTIHTQRVWIKEGRFPAPIERGRSDKFYTEEVLDKYAASLIAQAS
jgi:hypothetical protein